MRFGSFRLHSLSDGFFGLDGGAMFGVVPRPLWMKTNPPDERNRIKMALRPLLIVTPEARILVDTGIGNKMDAKWSDIYRIEHTDTLEASLGRVGYEPNDITHVVLTHLHFDHAGGGTKFVNGKTVSTFPNARYLVQRTEWEDANAPNRRSRASYLPENFIPLMESGQLELVDGSTELLPGIELVHAGGHTRGLQLVKIRAKSGIGTPNTEHRTESPPALSFVAMYWSDMIPMRAHISTPYIMGFDLFPLVSMEQKERLVNQACDEHWLSFLGHDPEAACGYIRRDGDRYRFELANVDDR